MCEKCKFWKQQKKENTNKIEYLETIRKARRCVYPFIKDRIERDIDSQMLKTQSEVQSAWSKIKKCIIGEQCKIYTMPVLSKDNGGIVTPKVLKQHSWGFGEFGDIIPPIIFLSDIYLAKSKLDKIWYSNVQLRKSFSESLSEIL